MRPPSLGRTPRPAFILEPLENNRDLTTPPDAPSDGRQMETPRKRRQGRPAKPREKLTYERVTLSLTEGEAALLDGYLTAFAPGVPKSTAAKSALLKWIASQRGESAIA
jgi:hypothetical protein